MSNIVSDQSRKKLKRPKAAGEGEASERGKPVHTISQRSHRRRSKDIAEDHGFSPPKDSSVPSAVEMGFSPPKGGRRRFGYDDDELISNKTKKPAKSTLTTIRSLCHRAGWTR